MDPKHTIKMKIDEQYRKYLESAKDKIKEVFKWMSEHHNLPTISEYEVVLFLNATEQHLDATKKLILDYYTYRTMNPNIFGNRIISGDDMQNAKSNSMFVPLPGYSKSGNKVLYCKVTKAEADGFDVIQALKLFAFSQDLLIMEEGIVPGYEIIVDINGYTLAHIEKFTKESTKHLMDMIQTVFLGPLKGFIYINTAEICGSAEALLHIMKPLMTAEFNEILHFYSTMDMVYKNFPKEMFPNELGGCAGTREELRINYWNYLNKYAKYFIEEEHTRRLKCESTE